jgi:hypothetical protein
MPQLFTNNAWSFLNGGINNTTTSIALTAGTGARFPNPTGGDFFLLTLIGLDGNGAENSWEIVKVTARSVDTLTVVRAQEGTTAVAWASGTRAELRFTAAQAAAFEAKLSTADIGTSVQAYNANYTRTDVANTFVNGQIISSSDAGAGEVLGLRLDRLSASPAAGDYGTGIRFGFLNSAATYKEGTGLRPQLINQTAGAETTKIDFITISGGTVIGAASISSGVLVGSPTGGDKGAGTLNATNLYVNNSAVLKQNDIFVSADQTITLAGALTLAHGLGVAPRFWSVAYVCWIWELGYAVGDIVDGSSDAEPGIQPDATNLNVRYSSSAPLLVNKTTGVLTPITAANWKARFFAIK